ncbi:hypothetical protein PENCOP_c007G06639 [Penicillium coprophilum]|uniref:Uncharacterized protein n=1 Tax=Penicillium coprophilum TaxID=36646 RepID=A0A1V6UKK4_9EURO|nr:hypothetical protein PENCOP_c007G06639 [Penicillium coprophilum]
MSTIVVSKAGPRPILILLGCGDGWAGAHADFLAGGGVCGRGCRVRADYRDDDRAAGRDGCGGRASGVRAYRARRGGSGDPWLLLMIV